jgi:hypothetical protein
MQTTNDSDKSFRVLLVVFRGFKEQESFVVLGNLLQFFAFQSAVVEDSIEQLLYFFRFFQEQFLRKIVEQWREIICLFNKE